MGGFTSQVQPTQISGPASKGSGMSANQMGMNPIQVSPEEQLLKTQQLQTEQPNFPNANQIQTNNMDGTQIGGLGGILGGKTTMSGMSGQPKIGLPNAYSNTLQPWDNSSNQQGRPSGKGMGASGRTGKGA